MQPTDVTLDAESACPNSGMQCITNNMRLPSPATLGASGGKIGGKSFWEIMRVDTLLQASLMFYTNVKANAPKAFPNLVLNDGISYLMAGFGPLNYGALSKVC
ncbi:hypothetical protein HaLaN_17775 [Haematococcus lacustris]|uniref:Uncharacterized protein n=1 Tax=Haematococcus lacustris TaxID=44745 RepID=A0A699ZPG6_HAELA|nr:hypothetical protein HaLaN_17775 [Haematococcus lacustris]